MVCLAVVHFNVGLFRQQVVPWPHQPPENAHSSPRSERLQSSTTPTVVVVVTVDGLESVVRSSDQPLAPNNVCAQGQHEKQQEPKSPGLNANSFILAMAARVASKHMHTVTCPYAQEPICHVLGPSTVLRAIRNCHYQGRHIHISTEQGWSLTLPEGAHLPCPTQLHRDLRCHQSQRA